jgi:hypothetical protein
VKILDFGLARPEADTQVDNSALTAAGAIVGTPGYMSPEQARGEAIDHRTNLFSLGVVLYQMTTGEQPFKGSYVMATLTAFAVHESPLVQEKNPQVPHRLEKLIHQLLAKDPADRVPTEQAEAEELRAVEDKLTCRTVEVPQVVYVPAAVSEKNPFADIDLTTTQATNANVIAADAAPAGKPVPKGRRKVPNVVIGSLLFGLLGLVLGGYIIIKITNNDESVTELKVPDDSKVEMIRDGNTVMVNLGLKKNEPDPSQAKKASPKVDPLTTLAGIDYTAKRKAAEWLAKLPGVEFELLKGDGSTVTIRDGKLPAEPFAVYGIWVLTDGKQIDNDGLAHRSGCRVLSHLQLRSSSLTDEGFKNVKQLRTLQTLDVAWSEKLGDGIADILRNSPDLHTVIITGTRATQQTLNALQSCPHVRVLHLHEVTAEELESVVKHCPEIEDLLIENFNKPIPLTALTGLRKLRKLNCHGDLLTPESIDVLAMLPEFDNLLIRVLLRKP